MASKKERKKKETNVSKEANQTGVSVNPRRSPLRVEFRLSLCCCGESALAVEREKKRRVVADSRALSPALRACSALNEWERRAQCLLDKPTPIGHSLH